MSKNIVIFADGTGNKGGSTPDSNVFKLYHALDFHHQALNQIAFYDNGVGTASNRFKKAIDGALGFGFKRNVKDEYEYLARHYEDHDKLYFFGFSRGAATVRSCVGLLSTCGLIDGKSLSPDELQSATHLAFHHYAKIRRSEGEKKESLLKEWHVVASTNGFKLHYPQVHFLGVWDTVAALGFPKRVNVKGIVSLAIDRVFEVCDLILDRFFQHRFYAYSLPNSVQHAYQALSIDDARKTFWPLVWDEKSFSGTVEQVWFAGVHSNVGGGYERQGLSDVSLHWMMLRGHELGLKLRKDALKLIAASANAHDHLYDSRSGFGAFYRYYPRDLEALSHNQLNDPIKIHQSVIDRITLRTCEYAPFVLPPRFSLTSSNLEPQTKIGEILSSVDLDNHPKFKDMNTRLKQAVSSGINLYTLFIYSLIFGTAVPWLLHLLLGWGKEIQSYKFQGLAANLDDYAHEFFDPLIKTYVTEWPLFGVGTAIYFAILGIKNFFNTEKTKRIAWQIGQIIIRTVDALRSKRRTDG